MYRYINLIIFTETNLKIKTKKKLCLIFFLLTNIFSGYT